MTHEMMISLVLLELYAGVGVIAVVILKLHKSLKPRLALLGGLFWPVPLALYLAGGIINFVKIVIRNEW